MPGLVQETRFVQMSTWKTEEQNTRVKIVSNGGFLAWWCSTIGFCYSRVITML
jgi:hypothetical protein